MARYGELRFEAEWVARQSDGGSDGFERSQHDTKEQAEAAAISGSKAAAQCEWILVAEQKYIRGEWVDQRRWTGDWDGLHDCSFEACQ